MASDRFIQFNKGQTLPTLNELHILAEDYLGGDILQAVEVQGNTLIVRIRGMSSFPFKRIAQREGLHSRPERWFEVILTRTNVDVLTREQDEFTNVLAQGFVGLITRYWGGSYEE